MSWLAIMESTHKGVNLAIMESTHKGVNQRLKDVRQAQQQRSESPTVNLTWRACNYKLHELHKRCILILYLHACQVIQFFAVVHVWRLSSAN